MARTSRDPRHGSIPLGLLGMLALGWAVEGFVGRHERDAFTTLSAASWQYAAAAARGEAARAEILCFGDSLIKVGIVPPVLQARTGRSAQNLAAFGGPPALSYMMLRRALEAGARPQALIVDMMLDVLGSPIRCHERLWQELVSPREAIDLAIAARDPTLVTSLLLGRFVPSVRARFEVRAHIDWALRGQNYAAQVADQVTPRRYQWQIYRGGELAPPTPPDRPQAPADNQNLYPVAWRRDRASVAFMHRFFRLAAARGIPVYWLLPPLSPNSQARRELLGVDSFYTEIVQRVRDRYPNVVVVDARRAHYAADVFVDSAHLDRRGAVTLSAELADRIGRDLDRGSFPERWLALPKFRERPIDTPLEDLDQTRFALKNRRWN